MIDKRLQGGFPKIKEHLALKYALIDRGDSLSAELARQFHELAAGHGLVLDEKSPDIVLTIGGDGTMLQAFHRYSEQIRHVAFVGIHTGHLGFYADWKKNELEQLAELIATKTPRLVQYPLIQIEIVSENSVETRLALNEFTLKSAEGTLVAAIHINDEMFEMFRGDGIVISTPSGSTGYNKSLGGAVIHPSFECIQIAEMASINNRVYRTLGSSIILPKHHHCDIVPDVQEELFVGIDHLIMRMRNAQKFTCRVSKEKITFARYRPYPFWTRVRDAFIGSPSEH
jgi:NAD+ kinase